MVSAEELASMENQSFSSSLSVDKSIEAISVMADKPVSSAQSMAPESLSNIPVLTLSNLSLDIKIEGMNGAFIGRKQGPYTHFFQKNMYVSGVHAQLRYTVESGWSIADKHSSNGTRLNGRQIQPDVEMSLNDGDVVTIANVNLQVSIKFT
jgi:pSer/pThr/pTyr-binding forkhead associated (FHA) protein